MTTTATPSTDTPQALASSWRIVGMVLLCVRFVQGWIYWGGGSRRFIYAPSKLDPSAHHWMANKFQTAMPGALLGMDHLVSYMLQHFYLLYVGVIIFSLIELFAGLFLIVGFLTRISALVTIGLSFVLMLLFGWQGATCIDEWTMAASNFGIGATLFLGGAGAYSIDAWLMKRRTSTPGSWYKWVASDPLPEKILEPLMKFLFVITVVFVVGTYSYYRGSVIGPFHGGPVSPAKHHVKVSNPVLRSDGAVSFDAYIDGGTADVPAHIARVAVLGNDNIPAETWSGNQLAALDKKAIVNDYIYNKFKPGIESLEADVGAKATINLPPAAQNTALKPGNYVLQVLTIDGKKFSAPVVLNN
ncbi:MAG: TQO small subunit DoxD [Sulfuriferula sp.]